MKHDRRTFLRNSALASSALTLRNLAHATQPFASATAEPVDPESIRRQFQSPAKKYGPIARWWWPGNDVTDEELQREIGVLDRAGFAGAEIQAFNKGFDPQSISPRPDAAHRRLRRSLVLPPRGRRHRGGA